MSLRPKTAESSNESLPTKQPTLSFNFKHVFAQRELSRRLQDPTRLLTPQQFEEEVCRLVDVGASKASVREAIRNRAMNASTLTQEVARQMAESFAKQWGHSKKAKHWSKMKDTELTKLLIKDYKTKLTELAWKGIQNGNNSDRIIYLDTGANLHASIRIDAVEEDSDARGKVVVLVWVSKLEGSYGEDETLVSTIEGLNVSEYNELGNYDMMQGMKYSYLTQTIDNLLGTAVLKLMAMWADALKKAS